MASEDGRLTYSEKIEILLQWANEVEEKRKELGDIEPCYDQSLAFKNYKEAQKRWDDTFSRDR